MGGDILALGFRHLFGVLVVLIHKNVGVIHTTLLGGSAATYQLLKDGTF